MHWIYLSPHFDDAVLSCGGMIWEQVQSGETVEIWTLCAGQIPKGKPLTAFAEQKHRDWKVNLRVVNLRRAEDRAACALLGAAPRHWTLPDIIYRRLPNGEAPVNDGADLWLPVHPGEMRLTQRLRTWLRRNLPPNAQLVCPLTLGNHTDHRLVRTAAESLRRPLYYYADYPYIANLYNPFPIGFSTTDLYTRTISPAGLAAWQNSTAAYESQVDDLFGSMDAMREKIAAFWQTGGGSFLWRVNLGSPGISVV